ncbi:hypothetical protein O181_016776 [Austropuccinia psidii MF-1]|uniref:Uncharacterized protein n=1 Tax=Austropuccinia psidii MF-1 TaxID=1389203 RepID=A0A9Q3C2C2_9BASI|nr:hypothetical protein [Austropuccinia psidii MF-1]
MKCCRSISPDSQGENGRLNKDLLPKRKNRKVHSSSTKCTLKPSRKNCQKPGKHRSSVIAANKESIQSQSVTSKPILLSLPIKKVEPKRRVTSPIKKKMAEQNQQREQRRLIILLFMFLSGDQYRFG